MSGGVVQGLGEGPAGLLIGTGDLCIQRWDWPIVNKPLKFEWEVRVAQQTGCHKEPYRQAVWCLAATDQVVVTGFPNGDLGITKMDTF